VHAYKAKCPNIVSQFSIYPNYSLQTIIVVGGTVLRGYIQPMKCEIWTKDPDLV
jgi:hypothetical protein